MSSDIVFPLLTMTFEECCVLFECGISQLCVTIRDTLDSQNTNAKGLVQGKPTSWLVGPTAVRPW